MVEHERIPIVSQNGCTIYGRIVGPGGRLGQFEVFTDLWGHRGSYARYAEAEREFEKFVAKAEAKHN